MDKNDTIIVVGVTETDEYGNLWVTPKGDGDKVKIAKKREGLHHLFEQGKAVMLHWETYMNKPYVADAKLVEGELPSEEIPKEKKPMPPKPTEDPTRRSIERQVALKCATEFAVAKLQAGKEIKSTEVASVAIIFDRFVSGNASLEKVKPTKPEGEE